MNKATSQWQWLSDPTSIWWLKAADFWLSALGFVITVITLIVAVKAKQAAQDAKIRVKQYDAASGSTNALVLVTNMFDSTDRGDWKSVNRSLADVRQSIISIHKIINAEDGKLNGDLKRASRNLQKLILALDAAENGQALHPDKVEMKQTLRKLEDTLRDAQRHLQEQIV